MVADGAEQQLAKFLKFFRSRMKSHLENIEADFEDTHSDRCDHLEGSRVVGTSSPQLTCLSPRSRLSSDDVYSQKDVKEAIDSLCFAVKVRRASPHSSPTAYSR